RVHSHLATRPFSLVLPRPPPRSTLFPYTTLFRSYPNGNRRSSGTLRIRRVVQAPPRDNSPFYFENGHSATLTLCMSCGYRSTGRSEEHTSELQSRSDLVCRLLLEKKKITDNEKLI